MHWSLSFTTDNACIISRNQTKEEKSLNPAGPCLPPIPHLLKFPHYTYPCTFQYWKGMTGTTYAENWCTETKVLVQRQSGMDHRCWCTHMHSYHLTSCLQKPVTPQNGCKMQPHSWWSTSAWPQMIQFHRLWLRDADRCTQNTTPEQDSHQAKKRIKALFLIGRDPRNISGTWH